MNLDTVNKSFEVVLAGAVTTNQLDFVTSYADYDGFSFIPGSNDGTTNDTTAVTIVSAPTSGFYRTVKYISVYNNDTVDATVTIQLNNNSTLRNIFSVTLSSGDNLLYIGECWKILNSDGQIKQTVPSSDHGLLNGLTDDDHPQYLEVTENLADLDTASTARSNLGLGNVPNEDATDPANWDPAKTDGNFLVGDGSTFVAESGSTALTSLGLSTNLANLTDAEVGELENIGTETITNTQWGYLGALSAQPLENIVEDTTPQFGGNLDVNGKLIEDANGNELLDFSATASAVNYWKLLNSAPGDAVELQAQGDDATIDLVLTPKATGKVGIRTNNPSDVLEVNGNIKCGRIRTNGENPALYLEETDESQTWRLRSGGGDFHIRDDTAGNDILRFEPGAPAQSIYMDSDGNVGIGTSSPAFAFDARITADKSIGQFTQEGAYDGTVYLQARGANSKKSLWYSLTKESNGNNSSVAFGAFEDNAIIEVEGSEKVRIDNVGNVGIGTASPNQQVTIEGTMDLKEQSAAGVDTAAYGQIWVKDSTPNELYFTDDAGTDTQISSHPLDAPTELYVNGPGLDWIGKRVQNYAGEIYWQTTDGTITIETFAEYNSRRQDIEGHVDLVAKDWDKVHRNQAVTKYMAEEIEVSKAEALEEKEKKEKVKIKESKTEYELNEETGEIEPVEKEESTTTLKGTGEYHKALKEGVRLDTETGKLYRKRTETEAEAMVQSGDIPSMPQWIKNRMK